MARVLVSGAGVGGLALAVALRERGLCVTVFEREASIQGASARSTGLALWPNGVNAARRLAPALRLDERILAGGSVLKATTFFSDGSGSGPGMRSAHDYVEEYGAPAVTLRWRALNEALASALPEDTVTFGSSLVSYEVTPDGVRATFADASGQRSTHDADILVGADGIRSAVRAQLFGADDPAPLRSSGRIAWRAVVADSPQMRVFVPAGESMLVASPSAGDGGKTMTLMHVGQEFYWGLGALESGAAPLPSGPEVDAVAARTETTFAGWPAAQAALAATPRGAILQQRLYDRAPLPADALSKAGPVTLLGDAMHAMIPSLGQGACSALEGALELAQCLAACEVEMEADGILHGIARPRAATLRAALRRYEVARLQRVAAIQTRSASAGAAAYKKTDAAAKGSTISQLSQEDFTRWLFDYVSPHPEVAGRA